MKQFFLFSIIVVLFLSIIVYNNKVLAEIKTTNLIGVEYTIKKHDNFIKILKKAGLKKTTRDSIIIFLEKQIDLQSCLPGEKINIFTDRNMNFRKLEYHKDISHIYIVEKDKSFVSYQKELIEKTHIDFITGTIKGNMYKTFIAMNEKPDIAQKIASIFAWEFDCNRDLRTGDKFEVLIEKIYINDQFYKYGNILYVSYKNKNNKYEAFLYNDNYYDRNANSLRGYLMKSPLAFYTRISSGYNVKRFHPILKRYLPHLAIDYAAPVGTPVYAAGDGKIIKKYYDRYGGRLLVIRHKDNYITEYMHLYAYSKKARLNNIVKQGDIIGYVGKSGLATGSHLHFAVKHNGVYINPRRISFNRINIIPENKKYLFFSYIDDLYNLIFAIKSFKDFPVYYSKNKILLNYEYSFNKSAGL